MRSLLKDIFAPMGANSFLCEMTQNLYVRKQWKWQRCFPCKCTIHLQSRPGVVGCWMLLGKLPVPGRPTYSDYSGARAYCAYSSCGLFGHFSLLYHFSLLFPSLWERLKYCLKGPLSPRQPSNQSTRVDPSGKGFVLQETNPINTKNGHLCKIGGKTYHCTLPMHLTCKIRSPGSSV